MRNRLVLCGLASVAFLASSAQAAIVGSLGGGGGPYLALTDAGLDGGAVASLAGGNVLSSSQSTAAMPEGTVGNFLAAGPDTSASATLTFGTPVDYLSFLWGSPDTYNLLTLTDQNNVSTSFRASDLGFSVTDGNQSFAQYVQFSGTGGDLIKTATFSNDPSVNAFETANFSVAPVPEPATWAMMLLGFGGIGFAMRTQRRKIGAAAIA